MLGLLVVGAGCRPGDVLSVPGPAGVLTTSAVQSQVGAEGAFNAAKANLFAAADGNWHSANSGLLTWQELLTDEFTFSAVARHANVANIDARLTAGGGGFTEPGDFAWPHVMQARSALLVAIPALVRYEPASGRSKIGEAYALAGYAELLLAEAYCAGTPLDQLAPGGEIQYSTPLTTDSLLGVAETHFDSAIAEGNGDATVAGLASVGLGRAMLDRGGQSTAEAAVRSVPTSFVYNVELEPNTSSGSAQGPNIYAYGTLQSEGRLFNVADGEGANGLDFVSAHDPRLVLDTISYMTLDGTAPWRLPTKFGANFAFIPLATGIEARLIEAEAALKAGQAGPWLADLNALRNSGCTVSGPDTTCSLGTGQVPGQAIGLPSLSDPGTDSGRVSLTFRERAFWLFGTGTRLGDLRRLIRQYGRDQGAVFPTGPYVNGNNPHLPVPIPNYGTDVSLTLPTAFGRSLLGIVELNPTYKGCIASTKAA